MRSIFTTFASAIMNLIIDIGNTRAKAFVFEGNRIVEGLATDHTLKGIADLAQRTGCQRGIFSSVAYIPEEGTKALASMGFPILQLTGQTPTPIRILYRTKETLGADRIAGIMGARLLKPEGDLLVIDAGTCITFDFLDSENYLRGGNISPGLGLRLRAMHDGTALLPLIEGDGEAPELGFDTATAMRSGVVWGMKYEIEGYIRHFGQEYPDISVFLTGGDIKKLGISKENCNFASDFRTDDLLVPRGLNYILNYNQ